ncbi:MAG TPA: glycosyl hydrolase [Solirubrobacterales bacterium]|nr:glycosyl hydrolase [Solirubrobacterales bacterium]
MAVAVVLIGGSSSSVGRSELVGVDQPTPLDSADLQTMGATNLGTVRFGLNWPAAEPSEGAFDWTEPDRFVGGLAAQGIEALPVVFGSPAWVSPNLLRPPLDSAADRAAWQAFLKAAIERYGPGGSYWSGDYPSQYGAGAPIVPVRAWQIWNEPNGKAFWAPAPSAKQYATLLAISRVTIKSADPGADVVLAGLVGYGQVRAWNFLDQLYGAGAGRDFDVAALHPYSRDLGQLDNEVSLFRDAMARHGDEAKPLWITELGWGSDPRGSGQLNVGPVGQERLLSDSHAMVLDHPAWHIQRLFWFDWRDPGTASAGPPGCAWCASAGLLRHDRRPKPAFQAFERVAGG